MLVPHYDCWLWHCWCQHYDSVAPRKPSQGTRTALRINHSASAASQHAPRFCYCPTRPCPSTTPGQQARACWPHNRQSSHCPKSSLRCCHGCARRHRRSRPCQLACQSAGLRSPACASLLELRLAQHGCSSQLSGQADADDDLLHQYCPLARKYLTVVARSLQRNGMPKAYDRSQRGWYNKAGISSAGRVSQRQKHAYCGEMKTQESANGQSPAPTLDSCSGSRLPCLQSCALSSQGTSSPLHLKHAGLRLLSRPCSSCTKLGREQGLSA